MENTKKFTIMELLVVIAIIAILMSLLMPMVGRVRTKAIKTKAKAEMNSIVTAVKSYEMTYGILPTPGAFDESEPLSSDTSDPMYQNLITYLTNVASPGTNLTADANNSYNGRGIRFLDVPNKYSTNGFVDPWGKDFSVLMDTDYDGEIQAAAPINEKLYGSIFVYTWVGEGAYNSSSDYVYSWK